MTTAHSARSAGAAALLAGTLLVGTWAAVGDVPVATESRAALSTPPPYDRDAFGGWASTGPGCDVRDAILARDADEVILANGCDVLEVRLTDPYSGIVVVGSTRGLDIDHVVPLAESWRLGAWRWSDEQRERFANDPENLLATTARENRSKGSAHLGEWLPQRDPCRYAERFDRVADAYGLDDADRDGQVREACAGS